LPAALGPDLSGTDLDVSELASAVAGHEARIAAASYASDSLTPDEVSALAAFLGSTDGGDTSDLGDAVALTAAGLLVLLVTLAAAVAEGRREPASGGGAS
jgi:hypothetical protein